MVITAKGSPSTYEKGNRENLLSTYYVLETYRNFETIRRGQASSNACFQARGSLDYLSPS